MSRDTRPARAAMQGNGFDNRNWSVQAEGISRVMALWERTASAVEVGDEALMVADYGSSQGRNSMTPVRVAIDALRAKAGQDRPESSKLVLKGFEQVQGGRIVQDGLARSLFGPGQVDFEDCVAPQQVAGWVGLRSISRASAPFLRHDSHAFSGSIHVLLVQGSRDLTRCVNCEVGERYLPLPLRRKPMQQLFSCSSAGCRPSRIASTISGASSVSRRTRLA